MLTQPISVREATSEDIPFMQMMIWEAIQASPSLIAQIGLENLQQHEEHYWRAWPEQPDPAFVALDADGHKLGALTLKPNDTDEPVSGWRLGIGVAAQARGQHVGQRLLERALAFATNKRASYINLFVDPTNNPAITLYQRMGFFEVGKRDNLLEMRIILQETLASEEFPIF
jgi:ribosomal protein S18 acetylase RimI-like enzyme